MTPGWERAERYWEGELADALGVSRAPMADLLAEVRRVRAIERLAVLELAEANSDRLKARMATSTVPVPEAASRLGLSPSTVYDWGRKGLTLNRVKGRKLVTVSLPELAQFLAVRYPMHLRRWPELVELVDLDAVPELRDVIDLAQARAARHGRAAA